MMFLLSCNTTKVIEKRITYIPDVDWPEFPKLPEYEKLADGKIATDEEFFRRLLIFKTEYKEEILKYNEIKMKLEENENE